MTQAQEEVKLQIEHLMREHFDSGVAVLCTEDEKNDLLEETDVVWHGGFAQALGLLRVADTRLRERKIKSESP